MLRSFLGIDGICASHQDPWPPHIECGREECVECYAFLIVSTVEDYDTYKQGAKQSFVSSLWKDEREKTWPHDCIALANYLCPSCGMITTIWNQA